MRRIDAEFGLLGTRLGYLLRRVDILGMELLSEMLGELGLTPARATALTFISLHEGCDQTELGSALGINRASAMATVNALVALGAVERHPGRTRRSNALRLTGVGTRLYGEIEQITGEHDSHFFAGLSEAERSQLEALLRKIRAHATSTNDRPQRPATLRRVK